MQIIIKEETRRETIVIITRKKSYKFLLRLRSGLKPARPILNVIEKTHHKICRALLKDGKG